MSSNGAVNTAKGSQHDTTILRVEIKADERTINVAKLQNMDKIQQVKSLVLNPNEDLEESFKTVSKESTMSEAVCIKQEKFDSDEEVPKQLGESEISKCRVLPDSDQVIEPGGQIVEDGVEYYHASEQEEYQILKKDSPVHFGKELKIDTTVKLWDCEFCGKEFRQQYKLKRHLPTHTDERNFKCETCGKAFRQMNALSQHRVIHSDARPYICEICKMTFNRVSTLISHRKTHSVQKPYNCAICGKGFHQKGNLQCHIFTHTNERPYKCDVCDKGFNQISNLMCHKAHSHGNKTPFMCSICHIEFPQNYSLRSHEEYIHGIKYRGGLRIQRKDPNYYRDIITRKQKRCEEKNLRIIHLQNGEKTLADITNLIPSNTPSECRERMCGQTNHQKYPSAGVVIDPINTRAMSAARRDGQTPFALLKPARGIPVLVKVMAAANNKQMLVPATADELKSAGKIVSTNFSGGSPNDAGVKGIVIEVPVVATVILRVAAGGQLSTEVVPPGPEQDLSYEQDANCDSEDVEDNEGQQNSETSSVPRFLERKRTSKYTSDENLLRKYHLV